MVKLKNGIKKVWFNMDNKKKLVKLKIEHNVLVIKLRNLLYRRKKINSELVKESEKHYTEVDLEKLELLIVKTSRKLMRILKVEKYLDSCNEDLSKENDAKEWCDESKKFSCDVNLEDWSF